MPGSVTRETKVADPTAPSAAPSSVLMLGGQAVIEGVMLRSARFVSVALRTMRGECVVETRPVPSPAVSRAWLRAPFVRGIATLADGLAVGTWALMMSAHTGGSGEVLSAARIRVVLIRSLTISITLFFLLPAVIVRFAGTGAQAAQNWLEGVLRVGMVLAFLVVIGRIPSIQRVFQYHGAEHKVVNAYEGGFLLNVETVAGMSRFHPRCGTTFLLMVLLVAAVVFAALGHPSLSVRLAERVLLLPVIASASYEFMRLAQRTAPFRPLLGPGLWLQRLTTREPDVEHLVVALAAIEALLPLETARPL